MLLRREEVLMGNGRFSMLSGRLGQIRLQEVEIRECTEIKIVGRKRKRRNQRRKLKHQKK